MVSLSSLWVPIVLSGVIVFVASSIIHMALPYHRSDYGKLPHEDGIMDALRKFGIPPGDYMMPRANSMKDLKTTEFMDKMNKGPIAMITVMKSGRPSMGPQLIQWFLFSVVVSLFAGYIASRALAPGAAYLSVQQIVGCTAFMGYALGAWPNSIWYKRKLSTTIKTTVDGLIYGLLTGGTFGWLWPKM